MPIQYHEHTKTFLIHTQDMSYIIHNGNGLPLHLHWGGPIRTVHDNLISRLTSYTEDTFSLNELPLDRVPQECPVFGCADLRQGMLGVRHSDGTTALDLRLDSWTIQNSLLPPSGLPSAHGGPSSTLTLVLKDSLSALKVCLIYTLFEDSGILARRVHIVNEGPQAVSLERALSASVDFEGSDFRLLTLSGAWARERDLFLRALAPGETGLSSLRGASSHQASPFMALLSDGASETQGEVYGFALCYSGNFTASADVDQDRNTRALIGIHPADFSWTLESGACFDTPEAYLCYSSSGLNGMSSRFHHFIQHHIVTGPHALAPRPILINNWEATYFDFSEEKLLSLARRAKEAGIDLFVLDDGWFGHRDSDTTSLGDWTDNLKKLPDGLAGLSQKIHALGLQFGIWIEPEMISPDSSLYHAHPDWCIHAGIRPRLESRHQLVLDLTRQDVRQFLYETICSVLLRGKVDYVKWDMNRNITMAGSAQLPAERMSEFHHRYILGLYDLLSRITSRFPQILFESCAGGGGRFDLGMMAFMPQAWTSDNTDAWARCRIQYATSLLFPPSCMGSHVSAVPNHQTRRTTPLNTRIAVAMGGSYGYELDLALLSPEELALIRSANQFVHEHQQLLLYGRHYRLRSPFSGNDCAFMQVSHDQHEALVTYVQALAVANRRPGLLRLYGLNPDAEYEEKTTGAVYGGDELMARGLPLRPLENDFASHQYFLSAR